MFTDYYQPKFDLYKNEEDQFKIYNKSINSETETLLKAYDLTYEYNMHEHDNEFLFNSRTKQFQVKLKSETIDRKIRSLKQVDSDAMIKQITPYNILNKKENQINKDIQLCSKKYQDLNYINIEQIKRDQKFPEKTNYLILYKNENNQIKMKLYLKNPSVEGKFRTLKNENYIKLISKIKYKDIHNEISFINITIIIKNELLKKIMRRTKDLFYEKYQYIKRYITNNEFNFKTTFFEKIMQYEYSIKKLLNILNETSSSFIGPLINIKMNESIKENNYDTLNEKFITNIKNMIYNLLTKNDIYALKDYYVEMQHNNKKLNEFEKYVYEKIKGELNCLIY